MISALVLTHNEAVNIEKCLASLSFCDEVLVVDDTSTDDTVARATKAGATVLVHTLQNNWAQQRNWAMKQAKNDWVLFVDPDEVVTPELVSAITSAMSTQQGQSTSGFRICRRDFFWNHEMKYGETASARTTGIVRLVHRHRGSWKGSVHEVFVPDESLETLPGFLDHYPHQTIAAFLESVNLYSSIRAQELYDRQAKPSTVHIIFYPLGKFLYTYILKCGFLDGMAGFVYSFMMAFHSFLVRAKLYTFYNE